MLFISTVVDVLSIDVCIYVSVFLCMIVSTYGSSPNIHRYVVHTYLTVHSAYLLACMFTIVCTVCACAQHGHTCTLHMHTHTVAHTFSFQFVVSV